MMCRAYPGPRCSPNAISRVENARKHLEAVQRTREVLTKLQKEDTEEGRKAKKRIRSTRWKNQVKNAYNRLAFAEKHYSQTPAGFRHYAELAEEARKKGDIPLAEQYEKVEQKGRQLRSDSYSDYHLMEGENGFLKAERSRVRALQSVTYDGENRYNIHGVPSGAGAYSYPYPVTVSNKIKEMTPEERQEFIDEGVVEWSDADYDRSYKWQEEGHRPLWKANTAARPKKTAGKRLNTISKVQRLNMPDGQVVESRADLHLCERPDGKFVVASRLTVASSWEDMTPLHRTQVPLGSYLARDRGIAGNTQYKETEYDTKEAAEKALKQQRRKLTAKVQARSSSMVAREGFISRLHRVAGSSNPQDRLSRFEGMVWPRYKEVA